MAEVLTSKVLYNCTQVQLAVEFFKDQFFIKADSTIILSKISCNIIGHSFYFDYQNFLDY